MTEQNDTTEAERMFDILNFARTHGRKIYEDRCGHFGKDIQPTLEKLTQKGYLKKVNKEGPPFYTLTSTGLNLFEDKRKDETALLALKNQIVEKLATVLNELEMKPWEIMFRLIHVIGNQHPITTDEVIEHLQREFPEARGIARPSVYRNLRYLRTKGYIEYVKLRYSTQNQYQLSEKGKEIYSMTKADATQKMRTSQEWDDALKHLFQTVDEERKQDDKALFYTLESVFPDLDNQQIIWIIYAKGNLYELKGNLDEAEKEYLHMEELCEEITDAKGKAYALKGLGNVAFKQERYPAAEQYYKRCQKIAQNLEDTPFLSDIWNDLGAYAYMDDDIDEALTFFDKALELVENDAFRKASTLYNTGLCYARKEDYPKAKELWSKSLKIYQDLNEPINIKRVKHNLRELDRKQKREFLEDNYRKAKETGTSEDIKKAYKELVALYMDDFTPGG
jgi:tetratricopeptide (TPR) repeat protein